MKQAKILLVDRSEVFSNTLKALMSDNDNFAIRSVSNEKEMTLHLNTSKTDLVLYDLFQIPESLEKTITTARKNISNLKFAFLSFETEEELIQDCLVKGADGFFDKGINDVSLLISAIERVLAGESVIISSQSV